MIRTMETSDWGRVKEIYEQALLWGGATFETACPDYREWDRSHAGSCRLVAERDGQVVGWAAIRPASPREAYRGVAEVSVYVDEACQGQGIGTQLLRALCRESERSGYWSLYAAIFASNKASISMHRACGFREIGYRERIAKDRFGIWRNTIMMERRMPE